MFGGRFVAETLMPLILELERAYGRRAAIRPSMRSWQPCSTALCRPAKRRSILPSGVTEHLGGAKIYFKRDELNHTGAHKINNVLGQILLARRMGKKRIIAETGAGQHGVATATACARFGLNVSSIWAQSMSSGRSLTSSACTCSGRQCDPGPIRRAHPQGCHERGPARLGDECRRRPSIASALQRARILIPPWCAIFSRLSAKRCVRRSWRRKAACRIH